VALAIVAAACGGDGVHVEIRIGETPGVTRVDLWLTDKSPCTAGAQPCDQIVLPAELTGNARVVVEGELYVVDDPTPFRSDVGDDGSAWFYLQPDRGKVRLAVAVGRGEGGEPLGTVILLQPLDTDAGRQHVRADLRAVTTEIGSGQVAAAVWPSRDDAPYHCVAVAVDDREVAIVPASDPDCDFVAPANECEPTIHLADRPPPTELFDLNCATERSVSTRPVCVLGGEACNEADPASSGCVATEELVCVPDAVCACQELDNECLISLKQVDLPGQPDTTRIRCRLHFRPDGLDAYVPCGTPFAIQLGTVQCNNVEIMALGSPLAGFASSLDLLTNGGTVEIRPSVTNTSSCQLVLPPLSAQLVGNIFPARGDALLKFSMVPEGPERTAIIPLELQLLMSDPAGCLDLDTCEVLEAPGERLFGCFEDG
jgi:hypothetical protein